MLKKSKLLLSLILVVCFIVPTTFAVPDVSSLQKATVGYYENSKTSITSFWEVGALYGAGVDLNGDKWTYDELNSFAITPKSIPTDYANYILAGLAVGIDVQNAVESLMSKQDSTTGAFSSAINQHMWAMITLDAAKAEYDRDKALQYMGSLKIADGGYSYAETDTVSDADLTAMALIALSNHKGNAYADGLSVDAVGFLKTAQSEVTAGFASFGTENPNTIATVISGLSAAGQDVLSDTWVKNSKTMVDALLKYKLDNGSYTYSLVNRVTDASVTAQALIAFDDILNSKSVWSRFNVPAPVTATIDVRIEGISSNILHDSVTITKVKPKAVDAIKKILDNKFVPYEILDSTYGKYLSSINGETAGVFGGYDGWQFVVNGASASVGVGSYEINDGDEIVIYYGGFAPGTLFPSYSISPNKLRAESDFEISVKSEYIDWNTNETISVKVEGATVKIGKNTYLTNENGVAKINNINSEGTYKVNISKEQENSFPAIVRIPEFEIKVLKKLSDDSSPRGGSTSTITLPTVPIVETPVVNEPAVLVVDEIESFKDKAKISDWALEKVNKAREYGIMTGTDAGQFEPSRNITRAEFTAMLVRLMKAEFSIDDSLYSDIKKNDWYYSYVLTARKMGLISGYDDNTFRPDNSLTREEMAVIISRAFILNEGNASFSDDDIISPWAKTATAKVSSKGIMLGSDGSFAPKDNVTREMAAVVVVRLYEEYIL